MVGVKYMNKKSYRKNFLSMAIVGVIISNVTPIHTFAIGQTVQQESSEKYSLGADGFKGEIGQTGSSIIVMDSYAQMILDNQTKIDFTGVNSINNQLQANVLNHQKIARDNAAYWLGDIRPNILQTAQYIVAFNTIFQVSYDTMIDAIEKKDNNKLKRELENLYTVILRNQKKSDELLAKLISFRNKLTLDTQNFKQDVADVTSILIGDNTNISLLQQQINMYNDIIKSNNNSILQGQILCNMGFWSAGNIMIEVAMDNIASAEKEIQNLMSQISEVREKSICLTNIKDKVIFLTDTIDVAIDSLQNNSNRWKIIGAKYNSLLQNIDSINPDELMFIKADLNTAKDSWQDLKNYVEELYSGIENIDHK